MKFNRIFKLVIFAGLTLNILSPSNLYTIFKENKSCVTSSINSKYWFYNQENYLGVDFKYYTTKFIDFGFFINGYGGLGGGNGASLSYTKTIPHSYLRLGLNYEYMDYYLKFVPKLWFNIAYVDDVSFDNTDLVVGGYRNVILEDKYNYTVMYFSFYYGLSNEWTLSPSFEHFINQFNETRNALKITLIYKYLL
jgi:hypothetical protein